MTETPGVGAAVGADISFNLIAALGGVTEQIKRLRAENAEERRQAAYARLKNYISLTAATTTNASGVGIVDLGTPAFGRVWTVRQLMAAVQFGELAANLPVNIAWYVGVNVPSTPNVYSIQVTSQWRDSAAGVPVNHTFTSDIIQARYGEHLFAIVNGPVGAANTELVFNAIVLDEPMKVGVPASVQG